MGETQNKKAMKMLGISNIISDLAHYGEREVLTTEDGLQFIQKVLDLFEVKATVTLMDTEVSAGIPEDMKWYEIKTKDSLHGRQ